MKNKIIIKENPNGDTRTAPEDVTFEKFHTANVSHQKDVLNVLNAMAEKLYEAGKNHDFTKSGKYEMDFYKDFIECKKSGNFEKMPWYNMHVQNERHHLLSRCPDDVNLVDVFEMVADCTVAGLARSGKVRPFKDSEELKDILFRAVNNTMAMIQDMCMIEGTNI